MDFQRMFEDADEYGSPMLRAIVFGAFSETGVYDPQLGSVIHGLNYVIHDLRRTVGLGSQITLRLPEG